MNDYYFIYKDSLGQWNLVTNPKFIARHTYCRAIKKTSTKRSINYIIHKLNSINTSSKMLEYLYLKFDLHEGWMI
jgi:hypothetical protein